MTSTLNSQKRKRKILTLGERIEVIKRSDSGETAISIAKSVNVGKTQIQGIVQDEASILERWEKGDNAERKYDKQRKCVYSDLNEIMWKWFCDSRRRNLPISGRIPELLENFHGQIQTEHLKKKSRVAQTPLTSFFPKITKN